MKESSYKYLTFVLLFIGAIMFLYSFIQADAESLMLSSSPQEFTFSCDPDNNPDILNNGEGCSNTDTTNNMYFWICDAYHSPVTVYSVTITSLSFYSTASRGNMEICFQRNSWKQYACYEVDTSPYNPQPYTHTVVFDPPIEHVIGMRLNVENFYFDNLEWMQCNGTILLSKYVEPEPEPEPTEPEIGISISTTLLSRMVGSFSFIGAFLSGSRFYGVI